MAHRRNAAKRPVNLIGLAVIALALVAAVMLGRASPASANFPTCDTNHSSYALTNCSDSGVVIDVRCSTANLRAGPGIDFNTHGSVVSGNNGHRFKIVFRGSAVNAGCGGLSTNEWWLAPIGWITRSALWN